MLIQMFEKEFITLGALLALILAVGGWLLQQYILLHSKVVENVMVSTIVALIALELFAHVATKLYQEIKQPKPRKG